LSCRASGKQDNQQAPGPLPGLELLKRYDIGSAGWLPVAQAGVAWTTPAQTQVAGLGIAHNCGSTVEVLEPSDVVKCIPWAAAE
jgi:hypothetical protein